MDLDKKVTQKGVLRRIFKWFVILFIFVILGRMVLQDWHEVKEAFVTFRPPFLILSIFIFAGSYFFQFWAWYLITLKLGIALSVRETLRSWFYSQLGKYLPGKVWLMLGRFYFYESRGKSKKLISAALYFEMVTIILAGGMIFIASLFLIGEVSLLFNEKQMGWGIVMLFLALISLHPRILQKVMNWTLLRFQKGGVTLPLSYSDILRILFVCILSWLVGGMGFYLFVEGIYPLPSKYFLFLTGALAISSTLGLIAFFVPAGLGVREGALVFLLNQIVPAPIAVILSVATRLWMTLIEIGLIGMIYIANKIRRT